MQELQIPQKAQQVKKSRNDLGHVKREKINGQELTFDLGYFIVKSYFDDLIKIKQNYLIF